MRQARATQSDAQPPERPPVLQAAAEIGLSDQQIGRLLGRSPTQVSSWSVGARPVPRPLAIALMTVLAGRRDDLASLEIENPDFARMRDAKLDAAQKLLDQCMAEAESWPADVIVEGSRLGFELLKKLRAADKEAAGSA